MPRKKGLRSPTATRGSNRFVRWARILGKQAYLVKMDRRTVEHIAKKNAKSLNSDKAPRFLRPVHHLEAEFVDAVDHRNYLRDRIRTFTALSQMMHLFKPNHERKLQLGIVRKEIREAQRELKQLERELEAYAKLIMQAKRH